MILVLDNYDSFVYNIVQYLGELGAELKVIRNDALTVEDIAALKPQAILISPGPCTPKEAGISIELLQKMAGKIPMMGVCLGHQAMADAFGGKVIRAPQVIHGKTSEIHHDGKGLFAELRQPFTATRYHSLIVEKESLPDCLEVSAWTEDGLIMGLRHRDYPIEGVQFHPESILTKEGMKLLGNFMDMKAPN